MAHIIKISDEELEFITEIHDVENAIQSLFKGNVLAVVYTKGAKGADLYIKGKKFESEGFLVNVQDTTGAGDAFIGGFLFKLLEAGAQPGNLVDLLCENHKEILRFANASGAFTTTGKGAISALPTKEQIRKMIE